MIISPSDAKFAAEYFVKYFDEVQGDISEYFKRNKIAKMEEMDNSLPGMGPEDEFFCDYNIHPQDIDPVIEEVSVNKFIQYLQLVASHHIQPSIPGKTLTWIVRDRNTSKIIGFIRLGSPTINSKPRNEYLGKPLDSTNKEIMKRFNESMMMGFIIIPVQPFGYNYLGGKLLAAICSSHYAREAMSKKYGVNICGFETTSLYGSSKSASQYDGMKPFLRYIGLTESNFLPSINDTEFNYIHKWFKEKVGGELVDPDATSRKMKIQSTMMSITKKCLEDESVKTALKQSIDNAIDMQEQKRTYLSTYGYSNLKEYLTLQTDTLSKAENYDRYELDSAIEWWKKKATKRYESLKSDGRLRSKLETWNTNPEDIDIIR